MKTVASVAHKPETRQIPLFDIRECLAGLDFDGSAEALLKYLDYFAGQLPVEFIRFVHVLPSPNIFNLYGDASQPFTSEDMEVNEEVTKKMRSQIQKTITSVASSNIMVEVKEGDPLEELLAIAKYNRSDLVVIGHDATRLHHGILTKNFARQVGSNALVVPSKAKRVLNKILIPIDFSENSAAALRMGVALNRQLKKPAKIGVLHTYDFPANYSAYRINQSKVMEMLEEDRENALQAFIGENVPPEDRKHVEPILLRHNHFSIGHYIASFAEHHGYNLIIMGAKGHSKVALLLMGSVTEKVLSMTDKVPVLVVK